MSNNFLNINKELEVLGSRAQKMASERFREIEEIAQYNSEKVLSAFIKNGVSESHFTATTGYGYDDVGRDNLERVYADVFHTEAALVRPQITCGTHALTVALSANLLPGDELLSPVGLPYDTLQEVIGIRQSPCSLAEYGVSYRQVDLLPDGGFDFDNFDTVDHRYLQSDVLKLMAGKTDHVFHKELTPMYYLPNRY